MVNPLDASEIVTSSSTYTLHSRSNTKVGSGSRVVGCCGAMLVLTRLCRSSKGTTAPSWAIIACQKPRRRRGGLARTLWMTDRVRGSAGGTMNPLKNLERNQ